MCEWEARWRLNSTAVCGAANEYDGSSVRLMRNGMQVHAAAWLMIRPTFRYALSVPGEDLFLATTRPCSGHPMGTLEWSRRDPCSKNSTPALHSLIRMASYAYHLRLACLSQEGLGFNRSIASPWAWPWPNFLTFFFESCGS